jgi:hypothetical protein
MNSNHQRTNGPVALRVHVRAQTGHVQEIDGDGGKLLVGAGAHCDVRVSEPGVAPVHALIEVREGGVVLFVHQQAAPVLFGGIPTREAVLGEEGTVTLGSVTLTAGVRRVTAQKTTGSAMTGIVVAATLVLAVMGVVALRALAPRPAAPPPEPVALFVTAPQDCHGYKGDEARSYGESELRHAEALRERYPFAVEDGPTAVQQFALAVACFEAAGDAPRAVELKASMEEFRAAVEQDYRVHHLRLQHALEASDLAMATREVDALRRLSRGRAGAYTEWLSQLDRRLGERKREADTHKKSKKS